MFTLRSFKQKIRHNKRLFTRFLTGIDKNPPRNLYATMVQIDKEVWKEVDCLACANCCKAMTPTYTAADMKRISAHLGMTIDAFKAKWLKKERGPKGDWINKSTPCQFLDLKTNLCSIYEVRPADCASFPHLTKKKVLDYIDVHKQNITECPAAYKMVEKLKDVTGR